MKLLFDQNLSYRLAERLQDLFPGSSHVRSHALSRSNDEAIWKFAKSNGFTIVTHDSDFSDLSMTQGFPPKIIWMRRANSLTSALETLLRRDHPFILKFEADQHLAVLSLW